jgi:hypothetical protein
MEKYPVFKVFKDGQDSEYLKDNGTKMVYGTNGNYPREGYEPSADRVEELQTNGYIGDKIEEPKKLTKDNTVDEIKTELDERGVDYDVKAKKEDLLALLDDENGEGQ